MKKNIKKVALFFGLIFCFAVPVVLQGMDPFVVVSVGDKGMDSVAVSGHDISGLGDFATNIPVNLVGLQAQISDDDAFYTDLLQPYVDALVGPTVTNSGLYRQAGKVKLEQEEFTNGKALFVAMFSCAFLQAISQNTLMKTFFSDKAHCTACTTKMQLMVNEKEEYRGLFTEVLIKIIFENMVERCYVSVGAKIRKNITWLFGFKPEGADAINAERLKLDQMMEEFYEKKFKEKTLNWSSYARSVGWSLLGVEGLLLLMIKADTLDAESVYGHYSQWLKQGACIGACSLVVETPKVLWRLATKFFGD